MPSGNARLAAALLLVVGGIALMFGFHRELDRFEEPIQIIIPRSVNGLMCFRSVPASTRGRYPPRLSYWVLANGFGEMTDELLQGRRPKQLFRAPDESNSMLPVADADWFLAATENGANAGDGFAVYWVGSKEAWKDFGDRHGTTPFCLNR